MDPDIGKLQLHPRSMRQIVQDIGYLLAGISSSTFCYDNEREFVLKPGVTLESLSPETFESFCQDFIIVGCFTRRLEMFCSSYNYSGHIVDGFVSGLKKFHRVYCNSILTLTEKFSGNLGQLRQVCSPLINQVLFLAKLCLLDDEELMPNGVSLISRILDSSVNVCNSSVTLLLTSLLSSSSGPYLRFLKLWLFSGKLEGHVSEFGLEIDPHHINIRDESYWRSAYNLIQIEGSSFLANIQQKVHLTGKSLALLILICPDHHLAGKYRDLQPTLQLAVTADQQNSLQQRCKDYETKMMDIAKECSESYSQKREKEEREKVEKLEEILKKNRENKLRREQLAVEARAEKLKQQQKLYNDLQEQARAVTERKMKEKEDKVKEDKRIEEEAVKMEEMVRQREAEEKARLEAFYAKLNAEAEERERKAKQALININTSSINFNTPQPDKTPGSSLSNSIIVDSPQLDRTVTTADNLKFELDDLGNISVMVEDQEGNIVSEIIDDLSEIDEEVKSLLTNDNFDSLPDNTKTLICDKINQKSSERNSPFPNINSRSTNKGIVLGSNIEFNYESSPPVMRSPEITATVLDNTDGVMRKKSSHGQQIERLLYPHRYYNKTDSSLTLVKTDFHLSHTDQPLEYNKSFNFTSSELVEMGGKTEAQTPADSQPFAPLTLILQNSILTPLRVQAKLVNSALLNHMMVDRQLTEHFSALRNYLLLADGESMSYVATILYLIIIDCVLGEFGRHLVMSLCQLGQSMDQPASLAGQLHSHLMSGSAPPHLLSPGKYLLLIG